MRRPKGYRKIVIDGAAFFWRLHSLVRYEWETGKYHGLLKVVRDGYLGRLEVPLIWRHGDSITPGDVASIIRMALPKWDPAKRGTVRPGTIEAASIQSQRREDDKAMALVISIMES